MPSVRKPIRNLLLLAWAGFSSACATLPPEAPSRALYQDLYKAVQLSEDAGWVVDQVQLQDNLEVALRSLCQTTVQTRAAVDGFLLAQVRARGGPAAAQFANNGGDLDPLSQVLTLERTRSLLHYAQAHLHQCPFYLRPDEEFPGVEGDDGRLVAWFESQGYGAVLLRQGEVELAGGGSGRALLGYGFSPFLTVALGVDVGGSGTLVSGAAAGNRASAPAEQLDTALAVATPLALRFQRFSRLLELDLAPVVRFNRGERRLPPGLRATVGVGFSTLRKGDFMPYILLWAAAEARVAKDRAPASTILQLGTRVGLDWDL